MESRCIFTEAKLEQKEDDFGKVTKELDSLRRRKLDILKRKLLKRINISLINAIVFGFCARIAITSLV